MERASITHARNILNGFRVKRKELARGGNVIFIELYEDVEFYKIYTVFKNICLH